MSSKHILGIDQQESGQVAIIHGGAVQCDHRQPLTEECEKCAEVTDENYPGNMPAEAEGERWACFDCGEVSQCAPSCHQVTDFDGFKG